METENLEHLFAEKIDKAMTYVQYREYMGDLVENKASSGKNQDEDRIQYTVLNHHRMTRLDKTTEIPDTIAQSIAGFDKNICWMVISESWCGDAAQILPVINKMALLNKNIDLKIVLRDENTALMQEFLTNGTMSIPKLIAFDKQTYQLFFSWGPRPQKATHLVMELKEKYGAVTDEVKREIQLWYNKDKGVSVMEELAEGLLSKCITAPEKYK